MRDVTSSRVVSSSFQMLILCAMCRGVHAAGCSMQPRRTRMLQQPQVHCSGRAESRGHQARVYQCAPKVRLLHVMMMMQTCMSP